MTNNLITTEMLKQLSAPMMPDEIEWRQQGKPNEKGSMLVVPYLTARAVMNRLDTCIGAMNWKVSYQEWMQKSVKCTIWIYDGKQWVYKEDGADSPETEPIKGAFSDALKRCAVLWGIGRDLYQYPKVWVRAKDGKSGGIPDEIFPQLDQFVLDFSEGLIVKPFYYFK